jgi:hypothetical protein
MATRDKNRKEILSGFHRINPWFDLHSAVPSLEYINGRNKFITLQIRKFLHFYMPGI